jgi:phosphatidylglycerophosphate synthase
MSEPLRGSVIVTQSVIALGTAGLADWLGRALDLTALYPARALGAFGVVMTVSVWRAAGFHPFPRFGRANQITSMRAALVALLVALVGEGEPASVAAAWTAVALGATAMALDGVDGWAARRWGTASAFGARFDVETDAALIQVLAVLVWMYGKAGAWVLSAGLLRYGFVAAGWMLPWMRRPLPGSFRARAICVVQVAALLVALAPMIRPPLSAAIALGGLLALSYSFWVDTRWLWLRRRTP